MSSEVNYRSLNIIHRVLSIVIALSLFTSSAPAAPRIVVDVTRELAISFYFWFHNSVFARLATGKEERRFPPPQELGEAEAERALLSSNGETLAVYFNRAVVLCASN